LRYGSAIVVDRLANRWALVCVDPDTHQYPTTEVMLGSSTRSGQRVEPQHRLVGAPTRPSGWEVGRRWGRGDHPSQAGLRSRIERWESLFDEAVCRAGSASTR